MGLKTALEARGQRASFSTRFLLKKSIVVHRDVTLLRNCSVGRTVWGSYSLVPTDVEGAQDSHARRAFREARPRAAYRQLPYGQKIASGCGHMTPLSG